MPFTKSSITILAIAFAARAAAHGFVQGITIDGVYHDGYNPSFQYQNPQPVVAGWADPQNLVNGFIAPDAYTTDDIICHLAATPGQISLEVAAGGEVELHWNTWPDSHHGPVIDYLANCNGDCADVNKTALKFAKINEAGLIDGSSAPGKWATDDLIANNNSWTATIPSSIAPGNYVLRHEIIALHSASQANGAQNYPQCINLKITGSGSDNLFSSTEAATKFYTPTDPGIEISIYSPLTSYDIPGPALMAGASSAARSTNGSQSSAAPGSSAAASTPAAASSSAVAISIASAPTTLVTSAAPASSALAAAANAATGSDEDSTCA
ncbi:MAG: hypothetical protein MMC23_003046 [Stictis urceolatum]|nr:hypothetical protein [Stictis urceolata]